MKKRSPGEIFLGGFLRTIILCVLLLAVGFVSYKGVLLYYTVKDKKESVATGATTGDKKVEETLATAIFINSVTSDRVDEIIVNIYNTKTGNADYIVVPNNTRVTMSDALYQAALKGASDITQEIIIGDIAKMYKDEETGYETMVGVLQELLGLDAIQHYETMNSDQFMAVINLIDAVEFDVPAKISYADSNGIPVEIEQGQAKVNGEQAAGILFASAGYADGELGRVSVSTKYLKAYMDSVYMIDSEADHHEYLKNYYKIVKGNNSMKIMEPYSSYLFGTKSTQVYFHVVEGEQKDSTYLPDAAKTQANIQAILQNETYQATQEMDEVFGVITSSKELPMIILNSTTTNGLAAKWQERMTANGYNINKVDTYRDAALEHAKIIVRSEGMGKDLLQYFPSGTIEVGELEEGIDIKIILGTSDIF